MILSHNNFAKVSPVGFSLSMLCGTSDREESPSPGFAHMTPLHQTRGSVSLGNGGSRHLFNGSDQSLVSVQKAPSMNHSGMKGHECKEENNNEFPTIMICSTSGGGGEGWDVLCD